MIVYSLDTNIISYLLKRDTQVFSKLYNALDSGNECIISPIVYYEVKRGLLAVNAASQLLLFQSWCFEFSIGQMNDLVWDKAVDLYVAQRRQGRPTEDADLFIAAFCIVNDYTLVTNNTKHFETITSLKHVNWKQGRS
jgi:tRNA(fMet)-specific endonuclease VapC